MDTDRIKYWLERGATPTDRVAIFLGSATSSDAGTHQGFGQAEDPRGRGRQGRCGGRSRGQGRRRGGSGCCCGSQRRKPLKRLLKKRPPRRKKRRPRRHLPRSPPRMARRSRPADPRRRLTMAPASGLHGGHRGAQGCPGRPQDHLFQRRADNVVAYGPAIGRAGRAHVDVAPAGRLKNNQIVAAVEGVEDRDTAAADRHTALLARADLPAPEDEDEFYFHDLIGLDGPTHRRPWAGPGHRGPRPWRRRLLEVLPEAPTRP